MHRLLQRQMRRAGMAPGTDPTPAQLEAVLGSKARSGQQFDAWDAAYGPIGSDGYAYI